MDASSALEKAASNQKPSTLEKEKAGAKKLSLEKEKPSSGKLKKENSDVSMDSQDVSRQCGKQLTKKKKRPKSGCTGLHCQVKTWEAGIFGKG